MSGIDTSNAVSQHRPTLRQVAEEAAVSITTASRVMRDDPRVAELTRRRVRAAAERLGFRVNTLASSLRQTGTSPLVGIVLPDVSDPFFAGLALGVEQALTAHGRGMVLACHHEDAEREQWLLETMVGNRLAALVVVPAGAKYDYLGAELSHGTPVVVVDRPIPTFPVDTVLADNREGVRLIMEQLMSRGHRRIALISESLGIWTQTERITSYRTCLVAAGIEVDPRLVRAVPNPSADTEPVVEELLALDDPCTAMICTHVPLMISTMRALERCGADVELASFDDHPLFEHLARPLLVVRQDPQRMGQVAADLAMARLSGDTRPWQRIVLPVELATPASARPASLERQPHRGRRQVHHG